MSEIFTIDNNKFPNIFVRSPIKRQAIIKDSDLSGFLMNGTYYRDVIGTYYNYTMTFDLTRAGVEEYTKFYEILTSPNSYHTLILPYNQTTKQLTCYITDVSDELSKITNGVKYWGELTVKFMGSEAVKV